MTLFVVLLLWSLASCGFALLVGRMIGRNGGGVTEPSYVLLPVERRSLRRSVPREVDRRR